MPVDFLIQSRPPYHPAPPYAAAVDDTDAQIKSDASAVLRKWPSLNNHRSKLTTPYFHCRGTLDECLRQFISKPMSELHLDEDSHRSAN
jgi:hypothetical protein